MSFRYSIVLAASFLVAQMASAQIEKGTSYLTARSGYLSINEYTPRGYGGLELDILAWEKVGIHYSLLFGEKYFHMPLAPLGGVFLGLAIAGTEDSTGNNRIGPGLVLGLLTAIIPEGISYNIKLSEKSGLAPYISPLQFEYLKGDGQDSYAGGAVGLRYHQYLADKQFRISPAIEYKIHYNKNSHGGISAGLNIAYQLKQKSDQPTEE